jgi:peptidoglycan LD-endopeptidase LytH
VLTNPAPTPAPTTPAPTTPAPTAPAPSDQAQPTTPSLTTAPETAAASLGTPTETPLDPTSTPTSAYAFPIESGVAVSFARTHHDYPATDIFAACGVGVVAAVSGTIDELSRTDPWVRKINDPTTRGGLYVSIDGDDGARYYTAHLQSIENSVTVGVRVTAGQLIGRVGRTGDASACHVHFGVSPQCHSGEWWVRRGVIWPSSYLQSWHQGGSNSPSLEITAWLAAHPLACTSPETLPWPSR